MTLKSQLSCGSGMDGQKGVKKGFVVCLHLHLHFITCLEVSTKLVGTGLLLRNKKQEKKKKTRYSTSVKLSTVKKYLISVLSSTTLLFSYTNFKLAVPHRRLTQELEFTKLEFVTNFAKTQCLAIFTIKPSCCNYK